MLFFADTIQNGGETDDFMFGHPFGEPNHVISGNGGNDFINGDVSFFFSSAGDSHVNAVNIDQANVWTTFTYPDFGPAAIFAPSTTIYGEAQGGAFDWYSVEVQAGQTITIDIDYGAHLIGEDVDTTVAIFSSADEFNALAFNDDSDTGVGGLGSTSGLDSFLEFTAPTTDIYRFRIGQFSATTLDGSDVLDAGVTYLANVTVEGHVFDNSQIAFGDDSLTGGDGDDVIYGRFGNDTLLGGAGSDILGPSFGSDFVDGGDGVDAVTFDASFSDTTLTQSGSDLIFTILGEVNTVRNVEVFGFNDFVFNIDDVPGLIGGGGGGGGGGADFSGPDNLTGTNNTDSFNTLGGADRIRALGGNDFVSAGSGADTVDGGGGADAISGQGGGDRLNGQGGRDTIDGGGGRDSILGGGGRDNLDGGGGRDTVDGQGGRDFVAGGRGADLVIGGGGADTLSGGRGSDTLEGGGGRDTFQFQSGDRLNTITDFRQGQDRIQIIDGADEFDDLSFNDLGDDVMIRFDNVRIRVLNNDDSQFTAADFIGIEDDDDGGGGGGGGGGNQGGGGDRDKFSRADDVILDPIDTRSDGGDSGFDI